MAQTDETLQLNLELSVPAANALIRIMKATNTKSPSDAISRALLETDPGLVKQATFSSVRR
ncbi:MAG: hypothetical protein ACU0DW_08855 [Shimia sp.]